MGHTTLALSTGNLEEGSKSDLYRPLAPDPLVKHS